MNWPTIVIALIIGLIFVAIIVKGIINRKNGKSSCSCGCSCDGCANSGACHGKK